MIRDPSDGTVRENPKSDDKSGEKYSSNYSGLPVLKEKADELARLERSREWINQRNFAVPQTEMRLG